MPTEPIFAVSGWQLLFTLINLLLNFFILKRFLYQPVKKMFEERRKEVEDTYSRAAEAEEKAEAMRDEYEEKIAAAKKDADEIVRSATRRAQLRSESIIDEAKTTASGMITRADEQIAAERKKAVNEIKNEIADIALMAAGSVLEKDMDDESHRKLIDEFIESVGDDQWQS
ncbi:MAG: F0F1 ATP synthase subunit B [Oscillospiraceae bacterium]|jgi:F-type H+-transporting ATPase subunit b|nr:F0F1 ATP synthase subunit B [Oscillospiraceae bacterium]